MSNQVLQWFDLKIVHIVKIKREAVPQQTFHCWEKDAQKQVYYKSHAFCVTNEQKKYQEWISISYFFRILLSISPTIQESDAKLALGMDWCSDREKKKLN